MSLASAPVGISTAKSIAPLASLLIFIYFSKPFILVPLSSREESRPASSSSRLMYSFPFLLAGISSGGWCGRFNTNVWACFEGGCHVPFQPVHQESKPQRFVMACGK